MSLKRRWWFILALTVGTGLGLIVLILPSDRAQADDPISLGAAPARLEPVAAMGAAAEGFNFGVRTIAGSGVETTDCYQDNKSQTLCFTIYNGSTDGEWIEKVRLTFPNNVSGLGDWAVACNSALDDPVDSLGYPVNFSCTKTQGYEVLYESADSDGFGEISSGASWNTCVDVQVPAGYTGDRYVAWVLTGDGATPDTESGHTRMEKCTPLTLSPSQTIITGCNGVTQTLAFQLNNYGAGNSVNVDVTYAAPGATFSGPTDLMSTQGGGVTFTVELRPDLCLDPGDEIVATLSVEGNGHRDASVITQTISETGGWRRRDDSPVLTMDNVVVAASDGLWSIGGYGSGGVAQRYEPESGAWITVTNPLSPVIQYPVDGCYGLNDQGQEIVVLFPDTIVTDTLQVFNITTQQWSTRPIPGFFPGDYIGHWGFDVVSLLNNPALQPGIADPNMCYLSGGNHQNPGGGTTRNLWRYDPEDNGGEHVDKFADSSVVFSFHASWYVPWIGDAGGICVAGGADHNHAIHDSTQCYDIGANAFNSPNSDLGTLPEPWWGMADGWQVTEEGEYELWIANGVAQNGTLLPASAYFREGMSGFAYGPTIPQSLYRLEGAGYDGEFYTLNGSRNGFWSSPFSLHLAACPTCHQGFLPLVLRGYR